MFSPVSLLPQPDGTLATLLIGRVKAHLTEHCKVIRAPNPVNVVAVHGVCGRSVQRGTAHVRDEVHVVGEPVDLSDLSEGTSYQVLVKTRTMIAL